MNRSGLTSGTRWCQACSPSFSTWEVIHEKDIFHEYLMNHEYKIFFSQKTIFLYLVTSPTYSIRLTANLSAQIDSGIQGYHLAVLQSC